MRKLGRILLGALGIVGGLLLPRTPGVPNKGISEPERGDGVSQESLKQGHEVGDARPMLVVYCAIGLFLTIFVIMGFGAWLQRELHYKQSKPAVTQYQLSFRHAPYAQTNIARDWDQINRVTNQNLETYHWVDRKTGVIGIPIEQAMQLTATEGLPARQGQTPTFPAPDQEMKALRETEKTHDITKSF